ncbi:acyl carrier protein [Burkholderia sp. Bp8963]|nr:acyl carrier protein [Burkholderia sp. Bp8963]
MDSLVHVLKIDTATLQPDMSLAESGIDSLGLVEAVFVIEQRFDISIPYNANVENDGDTGAFRSVSDLLGQIVDLVLAKRIVATLPQHA